MPHLHTCSETGAKVLYPPASASMEDPPDASQLELDGDWSSCFREVTGPLDTDVPPLERKGTLWDLFRELAELGLEPDARGYWHDDYDYHYHYPLPRPLPRPLPLPLPPPL